MLETLLSHTRLSVYRRTGSEGPKHDPYAFEELEVVTPAGVTVLHAGLGTWLKFNGMEFPATSYKTYAEYEAACHGALFERCTGYTTEQLVRMARRLKSRCPKCKRPSRGNDFVPGYPGEHLEVCSHCGHIVGGYFCESEII